MLLAFSVLTAHMHGKGILGFRLLYGNLAVQCFFMISGFYMALVLNEKYHRYGVFIGQRILRLFPAYFAVLALSLLVQGAVSFAAGKPLESYIPWFAHFSAMSWSSLTDLISSNLFLLGHQVNRFQVLDPATGMLHFSRFCSDATLCAHNYLFIAPAWTLSLELTFYLLAPALVRAAVGWQILLVLTSIVLRQTTSQLVSPGEQPWHMDNFFPYELAFFMAGSVAYQIYRHQKTLLQRLAGFTSWFKWVFFAIVVIYSRLPGNSYLREAIFVPLLFLFIPFLFHSTKNNSADRLIGELSYPFYLVHPLIIFLLAPWIDRYVPTTVAGLVYGTLTVGTAYVIYRRVDEKIDNYRHQLFEREQAPERLVPTRQPVVPVSGA